MSAGADGRKDEPDLPEPDRRILERRLQGLVTPALVAEHRARPFGPHSPPLEELLHFLRRNVVCNRPRYVVLRDGEPPAWRIGVMPAGERGGSFAAVDEVVYGSREAVEHAVFLRRLADLGLG